MERLFLSGPRALFGRKSAAPRPVEEVLAALSDAKPAPKRKRAPRKTKATSV